MKKLLATFVAVLAGLYLLVMVPTVDPIPFLDEGVARMVLLNALAYLGIDLRRIFGKKPEPVPVRIRSDRSE